MIEYKSGDILTERTEALVNTVNCVGVMGRGIALQFKKLFPENFKAYAVACKRTEVQPGRMFTFETREYTNPRYIINFPTKRHWRGESRIEDIESGLQALTEEIRKHKIQSIAIPPLGSGLGGLDWQQVRSCIETALRDIKEVQIIVYEPKGAPEANKMTRNRKVPAMTPGRAALVRLMHGYLAGLLDPFVTLLEVHKLMYFTQIAGEPLRLKYEKGLYGPYANKLGHVLHAIEGHLVSGYTDGGDSPGKELKLVPGALEDAQKFLDGNSETPKRLEKVFDLIQGFESPFGMELLSTVHWVLNEESPRSIDEVISMTHTWNERKKQFSSRQIKLACDVLTQKGWIAQNSTAQVG